jgi:Tfp pilus assembly protein PilF
MGYVCQHQREFDLAEMRFNRAMSLNPNDVYIAVDRSNWLVRVDKPAEALQGLEAAMQRGPSSFSPSAPADSWSANEPVTGRDSVASVVS